MQVAFYFSNLNFNKTKQKVTRFITIVCENNRKRYMIEQREKERGIEGKRDRERQIEREREREREKTRERERK